MADVTITAANVVASSAAQTSSGTAGAAITAGQALYEDASDGTLKLAQADGATAAERTSVGIALNDAATGQPVTYAFADPDFTPGGTVSASAAYVLSATAGGIAPEADLTTGDYASVLMIGKATNKAVLKIVGPSDAAHA